MIGVVAAVSALALRGRADAEPDRSPDTADGWQHPPGRAWQAIGPYARGAELTAFPG